MLHRVPLFYLLFLFALFSFRIPGKKFPSSLAEGALIDSEAAVLSTFDFLAGENVVDDEDENLR